MSYANFESERDFIILFFHKLIYSVITLPDNIQKNLETFADGTTASPETGQIIAVKNNITLQIDDIKGKYFDYKSRWKMP